MRGILVGTALAFCFCTPEAQNCTISIKIDNVLCDTLAHSDSSRYLPILIQLKNFTVIESTLVEPCEKSCTIQKYIIDTASTLSFLRKYDLYDLFEPSVRLDTTSITLAYRAKMSKSNIIASANENIVSIISLTDSVIVTNITYKRTVAKVKLHPFPKRFDRDLNGRRNKMIQR